MRQLPAPCLFLLDNEHCPSELFFVGVGSESRSPRLILDFANHVVSTIQYPYTDVDVEAAESLSGEGQHAHSIFPFDLILRSRQDLLIGRLGRHVVA